MMNEQIHGLKLNILMTITDPKTAPKVLSLLQKSDVRHIYQFRGQGTASSELLDVLGLGSPDKIIIACISTKYVTDRILLELTTGGMLSAGKGIGFQIPVSGFISLIINLMSEESRKQLIPLIEKEVDKMNVQHKSASELIVAVINHGYSLELMEEAKKAGATGGTIINARRVGLEEPVKFLGISMQDEKEIVTILIEKSSKRDIMKAVNDSFGIRSEANGIIFSIPVNTAADIELEK